ncbi:MAG: tRNA (guanosine(37)-N1)-methyltransferase TrmD [Candidatus Shikimatogenerans bostrichidophilus]|nr:MAG: tRNA (guanosine(37)-N1)-methyltransferase TrmD [Candidatus Shikimatogenerans bostrichidophilus]
MYIDIITLYPLFWFFLLKNYPLIIKALKKKKIKINIINLKKYGIKKGKKKCIDDYLYGGGYGMILKIEPIYKIIKNIKDKNLYIIYLSPDAKLYNNKIAIKLSKKKHILFICGYFKGIDQRIREYLINKEYSIGPYILSNSDLPTLVVLDTIIRFIPGILGNIKSTYTDTFNNKYFYEFPLYTRPYKYKNMKVPKILLSGNHKKIINWKKKQIKKKGTK